jgi:hypothetical protein
MAKTSSKALRIGAKVRTESGRILTVTKIQPDAVCRLPWGMIAMTAVWVAEESASGFYDARRLEVVS